MLNCSWKKIGAAERALIHSPFGASEVTRCQPRRSTAQESSEVQPYQFEEDYFHHFTCEVENNTQPQIYANQSVSNPRLSALPFSVSDLDRFRKLTQSHH
jgi:hypothetical protein